MRGFIGLFSVNGTLVLQGLQPTLTWPHAICRVRAPLIDQYPKGGIQSEGRAEGIRHWRKMGIR